MLKSHRKPPWQDAHPKSPPTKWSRSWPNRSKKLPLEPDFWRRGGMFCPILSGYLWAGISLGAPPRHALDKTTCARRSGSKISAQKSSLPPRLRSPPQNAPLGLKYRPIRHNMSTVFAASLIRKPTKHAILFLLQRAYFRDDQDEPPENAPVHHRGRSQRSDSPGVEHPAHFLSDPRVTQA